MRHIDSVRSPIALVAVLFLVLGVPAAFAAAPAAAPSQAPAAAHAAPAAGSTACASTAGPLTAMGLSAPLTEAVTPHCCSQQEIDTCRSTCKDQGPGCKGQIACRAGECDCTCVCP